MSVAAVIVYSARKGRAKQDKSPPRTLSVVASGAIDSKVDEVVVVVVDETHADGIPEAATVLLDQSGTSELEALRVAIDWSARQGHSALVVAHALVDVAKGKSSFVENFNELAADSTAAIVSRRRDPSSVAFCRLDASVWPAVPLVGTVASFLEANRALVVIDDGESEVAERRAAGAAETTLHLSGQARAGDSGDDVATVEELLGRKPLGPFQVVVRDRSGTPVVIENGPFLDDHTPMPTRYWLVGREATKAVSRLESEGGARRAEEEIDGGEIEKAHERYALGRDALIDANWTGPRPSGGVGGTRHGVKCLHAHLAAYLAGTGDPVGRWVLTALDGRLDGPIAAIDCGTNSTRLLISDAAGRPLERRATITRLGEGVDRSGLLGEGAIDRTLAALVEYRRAMDDRGVVVARAVATSAARDASNAAVFFDRAREVLGFEPELLGGEEEGRLCYLGATMDLAGEPLVVDLGGGSTELIAKARGKAPVVASLPVGCVRMTERFLSSDPPGKDELEACRRYVGELVEAALSSEPAFRDATSMIGVAGTVATLAALALGLSHFDSEAVHHSVLTRVDVERLLEELSSEPVAMRASRKGLEPGRAPVIVGGAVVLAEVMDRTGHDFLVHSESDILDGLVADLRVRR